MSTDIFRELGVFGNIHVGDASFAEPDTRRAFPDHKISGTIGKTETGRAELAQKIIEDSERYGGRVGIIIYGQVNSVGAANLLISDLNREFAQKGVSFKYTVTEEGQNSRILLEKV